jgi:hypothetical protein
MTYDCSTATRVAGKTRERIVGYALGSEVARETRQEADEQQLRGPFQTAGYL